MIILNLYTKILKHFKYKNNKAYSCHNHPSEMFGDKLIRIRNSTKIILKLQHNNFYNINNYIIYIYLYI